MTMPEGTQVPDDSGLPGDLLQRLPLLDPSNADGEDFRSEIRREVDAFNALKARIRRRFRHHLRLAIARHGLSAD
jgi:hypothetical protein